MIAVVAQTTPTVVEHRACVAITLEVGEETVVDPPGVAQVGPLLPVEPPEVDAAAFHWL